MLFRDNSDWQSLMIEALGAKDSAQIERLLRSWSLWTEFHETYRKFGFHRIFAGVHIVLEQPISTQSIILSEVVNLVIREKRWLVLYCIVDDTEIPYLRTQGIRYAQFRSNNILRLIDFCFHKTSMFVTIDKSIGSTSLKGFLETSSSMTRSQTWSSVNSMCCSVAELHSRELVHGELSPAFFELDLNAGSVRLIPNLRNRWTDETAFSRFSCPERTRGATQPTKEADVYSLGCCIYELITLQKREGQAARKDQAPVDIRSRIICSQTSLKGFSRKIGELLLCMVESIAERRIRADEIVSEFARLLESE